jgi:hypothetical protein
MKRILVLLSVLALSACTGPEYNQWVKEKEPDRRLIVVEHVVTQDGLECVILNGAVREVAMSCNWNEWTWKRNKGKLEQKDYPNGT